MDFRKRLELGDRIVGTFSLLGSSTAAECLALAGFDYIVIDAEHGPLSDETAQEMVRAAQFRGCKAFVRVRDQSRPSLMRMLDIGADGLIIPDVHSLEEVKKIVEYCKYYPLGRRGFGFTRSNGYGMGIDMDFSDYFTRTNREKLIIPQCETVGALALVGEIAALEGVDGIFVGPYDLSIALEAPAQFDGAEFQQGLLKVLEACKASGKLSMIYAGNQRQEEEFYDMGFDIVTVGTDVGHLICQCVDVIDNGEHEHIQESMENIMKELWKLDSIQSEPVYSLMDCYLAIDTYQEDLDDEEYEGYEDDEDDEEYDDETDILDEIKSDFRACLYLCNEKEIDCLRQIDELSRQRAPWDGDIQYSPVSQFCDNDYVYLFVSDGKSYIVLPDELGEIFREVMSDKDFKTLNARNLELNDYAVALLSLYGAYDIDHFIEVWNLHHKEKIDFNEAVEFLNNRMEFDSDYHIVDDYVVHDCMDDDEFNELILASDDLDYYMPSKSVVKEYADKSREYISSSEEKGLEDFLAGYMDSHYDVVELCADLVVACERLAAAESVVKLLVNAGLPLSDEYFRSRFESLFNSLFSNTHIWELRGLTPHQYCNETGRQLSVFKINRH